MMAKARWSVLGVLALGLASTGCVAGAKAIPNASFRSQYQGGPKCEGKDIKVVRQDGHALVLDVCGTYEDWKWSALNGWLYVGPSAEQPVKAPVDTDGDSIVDPSDACPNEAGPANADPAKNGCPPSPDGDADGVADGSDACPTVPGLATTDPKTHGCPPDHDGDRILDSADACPMLVGVATADPKTNGCPSDKDGDGIYDSADACPDVPGSASPVPEKNGCPKATLTATEIVIDDTIEFELGKAALLPESRAILEAVAGILKANPDITKIEVQGHTDDEGNRTVNRKLSQERAQAVFEAIVALGIEKTRLAAKGYGSEKPLVKEKTDEARTKNRRVQFLVLKRVKAGEAAAPSQAAPAAKALAPVKAAAAAKPPKPAAPKKK